MDGECWSGALSVEPDALLLAVTPRGRLGAGVDELVTDAGYALRYADEEKTARASMSECMPDVLVVDGRRSTASAASLCQRLADVGRCPILCLGEGYEPIDRIIALELGADAYLAEPVNGREFLATVRALLRRRAGPGRGPSGVDASAWRLNLATRALIGPGRTAAVLLTPKEQVLLAAFLDRPGRVLGFDEALRTLGGDAGETGNLKTVVMRLRRKLQDAGLDPSAIRSLRSSGYVFDERIAERALISA